MASFPSNLTVQTQSHDRVTFQSRVNGVRSPNLLSPLSPSFSLFNAFLDLSPSLSSPYSILHFLLHIFLFRTLHPPSHPRMFALRLRTSRSILTSVSSLVLPLLTLLHAHITDVPVPLPLTFSRSLFLPPSLSPCLYLLPSLSLLLFAACLFPSHFPALPRVEPLRLALPKLSRSRFKIIQLAPDHHPPPSLSRPRQRCRRLCRHPQGRSSSLVHRRVSAAPVTFR